MQIDTWKIKGGGFHFGEHGLGQEETLITFPSDSLYAALLVRLAFLEGDESVASFIQPFLEGKPPFLLTSTFPIIENKDENGKVIDTIRFYPMPTIPRSKEDEGEEEKIGFHYKDVKKIKYVSEDIFKGLIAGKPFSSFLTKAITMQGKKVLLTEEERQKLPEPFKQHPEATKIWEVEQRPRVTIERTSNQSSIYHTGRVYFAPDCGLWFAIHWLDEAYKPKVETLLEDLADAGLGGERSVGFGSCTIEQAEQIDLPVQTDSTWINLNRYLPAQDDILALQDETARYSIKRVGGWVTSPTGLGQRRRAVNLITEGSLLGKLSNPFPGTVVDIRPSYETNQDPLGHPVYRIGYAFPVATQGGGK